MTPMTMWDPTSAAAYGVGVPTGSGYQSNAMSPIGAVGAVGRPSPGMFSGDNPVLAFGVILGLTVLGLFAASYDGKVRLGPFKASGSVGAGK